VRQRFRADIVNLYDPAKAAQCLYPPLAILTSKKLPSCAVADRDGIVAGECLDQIFDYGDGIVLYESSTALPSRWSEYLRITAESRNGHLSLFSDAVTVGKTLQALL